MSNSPSAKVLLHQRRKRKKLSMEALGAKVGVTRQAVSAWEAGDTKPHGSARILLENLLGIPSESWDKAAAA